jgi:hypothetical protein
LPMPCKVLLRSLLSNSLGPSQISYVPYALRLLKIISWSASDA